MSEGERLLQEHKKHVSLYNALQRRIEQYRSAMESPDSVIENLALRRSPVLEVIGGHSNESPTENIVDKYHQVYEKEQRVLQAKIIQLEEKAQKSLDMLNLYDAVLAGLEQAEVWLVQEYFVKGRTLDDLAAEKDCVKSTMQSKKRKVIQKVDTLLQELCPRSDVEDLYEATF